MDIPSQENPQNGISIQASPRSICGFLSSLSKHEVVFDLNQKGESAATFLEPSWQRPKEAVHRFWREHGLAAPDLPFFLQDFNKAGSAIDERLATIIARPRAAEDSFSTIIAAAEATSRPNSTSVRSVCGGVAFAFGQSLFFIDHIRLVKVLWTDSQALGINHLCTPRILAFSPITHSQVGSTSSVSYYESDPSTSDHHFQPLLQNAPLAIIHQATSTVGGCTCHLQCQLADKWSV